MVWEKTCLKRCAAWNEIFIVPSSSFDCFEVNTHFYTWILRLNNTTTRFATFIPSTNSPFVIAQRYIMKGNVLSLFLSKYRKFSWSKMDWVLIGIVDYCNLDLWYWYNHKAIKIYVMLRNKLGIIFLYSSWMVKNKILYYFLSSSKCIFKQFWNLNKTRHAKLFLCTSKYLLQALEVV